MGGVLKIGSQPGNVNFDPALFAGAVPDILLQQQIYEKLVTLGQDFTVQPTLATEWDSPDGKVWTFTLRDGVTFSNGEPFTSADVVYTMDRLRSKKLGSPMADVFANVKTVVATDPRPSPSRSSKVDSEFPASLTDYRVLMLGKTSRTRPRRPSAPVRSSLKSISAEDRAILTKNPDYWGTDDQGNKLPYLDEIDFIYSPDVAGQVAGPAGRLARLGRRPVRRAEAGRRGEREPQDRVDRHQLLLRAADPRRPEARQRPAPSARRSWPAPTARRSSTSWPPASRSPATGRSSARPTRTTTSTRRWPYDQAKAKQLLADAGYADGAEASSWSPRTPTPCRPSPPPGRRR